LVVFVFSWFGEDVSQAVEAALPGGSPLREPLLGGPQCRGLDAAGAHATDFFGTDEAAGLEDLEVLDDCWEGEREWSAELAH